MTPDQLALLAAPLALVLVLSAALTSTLTRPQRPDPAPHRLNARQFATLEITKAALRSHGLTALKPEHIEQAKRAAALIIEDAP